MGFYKYIYIFVTKIITHMTTIECTNEKLALNLNPYQIFVFINEKTKPYLDQIKRGHICRYNIELIHFDAEKDCQAIVGETVCIQVMDVDMAVTVEACPLFGEPVEYFVRTEMRPFTSTAEVSFRYCRQVSSAR